MTAYFPDLDPLGEPDEELRATGVVAPKPEELATRLADAIEEEEEDEMGVPIQVNLSRRLKAYEETAIRLAFTGVYVEPGGNAIVAVLPVVAMSTRYDFNDLLRRIRDEGAALRGRVNELAKSTQGFVDRANERLLLD